MKKSFRCVLVSLLMIAVIAAGFTPFVQRASAAGVSAKSASKKGIQIDGPQLMYQAVELGCSSVFVNLRITDFISRSSSYANGSSFTVSGTTYYMNTAMLDYFNSQFEYGRANGIEKIYVQIYAQQFAGLTDTTASSAAYHAFDTATAAGRSVVSNVFEIVCRHMGKNVDYWIIGNEINDQHQYYEMGTSSLDTYVTNYERAMRLMYNAARNYKSDVCVMVCLDHEWNSTAGNRFNAKDLLTKLADKTKSDNYNWGVAIHPYPEPLTSANFWDDSSNGATNAVSTERITMYNLDVMTDFMQTSAMKYNSAVRPIAITECGFNALENGRENQRLQAAAYCYAYYKAEANHYIDAFIIRSYADNTSESAQGFCFGLKNTNQDKREIYDVLRYIDTSYGSKLTSTYLSYFGVSSWSSLVPGYGGIALTKTPIGVIARPDKTSITSGQTIKISTSVYGSSGTVSYQYLYQLDNGRVLTLKDYSAASSLSVRMQFGYSGYLIVNVKDGTGTVATDQVYIHVTPDSGDKTTGLINVGGTLYYLKNGKLDFSYSGLTKYSADGKLYYAENGVVTGNTEGVAWYNGTGYYVKNSVVSADVSDGLLYSQTDWKYYYMKNGKVDTAYTAIVVENGYVTFISRGQQVSESQFAYFVPIRETSVQLSIVSDDPVTFTCADSTIAKVSEAGVVTPLDCGFTTLEIHSVNWWRSLNVTLKVGIPFEDVPEDAWYFAPVADMYERRIMNGTSETIFSPSASLTRGQVVTMLWNYEGHPAADSSKKPFDDVDTGKYYAEAVAWAKKTGIISGYDDGSFGPADTITRQDLACILRNYARYKGLDISISDADAYKACSDYERVSAYAKSSIQWAYCNGLIGSTGKLSPKNNITRAEAASMLQRFLLYYKL